MFKGLGKIVRDNKSSSYPVLELTGINCIYFGGIFFLFFIKNLCFYNFDFFFWWSIEFLRRNIKQPETGIVDKKLSVELYDAVFAS